MFLSTFHMLPAGNWFHWFDFLSCDYHLLRESLCQGSTLQSTFKSFPADSLVHVWPAWSVGEVVIVAGVRHALFGAESVVSPHRMLCFHVPLSQPAPEVNRSGFRGHCCWCQALKGEPFAGRVQMIKMSPAHELPVLQAWLRFGQLDRRTTEHKVLPLFCVAWPRG